MCSPAAAGIIMGVAQMGVGIIQANAQHAAAQRAAQRRNQIAIQNYNNEIRVAEHRDIAKKQQHQANMEAYEKALQANYEQQNLNQLEANRALSKTTLEQKGEAAKLAFQTQKNISEMIMSQGTVLSTGKTGQSFALLAQDAERVLGFAQAEVDETLYNRGQQFALEKQGVLLDQYSADARAYNAVPNQPLSRQASLLPYKPILDPGPSKASHSAAVFGSIIGGVQSGFSFGTGLKGESGSWNDPLF